MLKAILMNIICILFGQFYFARSQPTKELIEWQAYVMCVHVDRAESLFLNIRAQNEENQFRPEWHEMHRHFNILKYAYERHATSVALN